MSCSSCGQSNCSCDPCTPALTNVESLASQLQNLTFQLFGNFTKTITNGRAVWSAVCSAESAGLSCNPRTTDEGLLCYILRLMAGLGLFFGGTWNSGTAYCKHTFVIFGSASYVALVDAAAGLQPNLNPGTWQLILQGTQGPAGPQGPAGSPGAGSPSTFAHLTTAVSVTLTNNDDIVYCEPLAPITISIPAMAGLDSGKGYQIHTNGAFPVTIASLGADTFDGAVSLVLAVPNESAVLRSDFAGKWRTI